MFSEKVTSSYSRAVDFTKQKLCQINYDVFHIKSTTNIYNFIVKDGVDIFGDSCLKN